MQAGMWGEGEGGIKAGRGIQEWGQDAGRDVVSRMGRDAGRVVGCRQGCVVQHGER